LSATSCFDVSVKGVGNLLALKPAFTIDMRSAESNQVGCGMRACTRKINLKVSSAPRLVSLKTKSDRAAGRASQDVAGLSGLIAVLVIEA
jgi:hypothetical protein